MEHSDRISNAKVEEIIELRSENTRRFIGEMPPYLVRIGTMIISFIVVLFVMAILFVEYKDECLFAILFCH